MCVCAAGRVWHHGGDVRELRALLPPDPAGALQKRRRSRLPAPLLQPRQQVEVCCAKGRGAAAQPFAGNAGKKKKVIKMGFRALDMQWWCPGLSGGVGFGEPCAGARLEGVLPSSSPRAGTRSGLLRLEVGRIARKRRPFWAWDFPAGPRARQFCLQNTFYKPRKAPTTLLEKQVAAHLPLVRG